MTLAQRVRDHRYAKGWGPDELASRASISRTALYQIESGRTEHPRAATLRRIAEALNVTTDMLLGPNLGLVGVPWPIQDTLGNLATLPTTSMGATRPVTRLDGDPAATMRVRFEPSGPGLRERDLERKLHELLASPLGESLARIVEESYRLLPRAMADSAH